MKKISEIISSTVISLFESSEVGIIYNITFDHKTKKCKYVYVLNEETNIIYTLKYSNIIIFGKDCTYIKNISTLELADNLISEFGNSTTPLNKKVYSLDGSYIGTCKDAEIDENGTIANLTLDSMEMSANKILNIGTVIIAGEEKFNTNKYKPNSNIKKIKANNESKVVILDTEPHLQNTSQNKIITDARFLMGRKIIQDILAFNGELIARSGATITKDILNKASNYGKLVEIARYSTNK